MSTHVGGTGGPPDGKVEAVARAIVGVGYRDEADPAVGDPMDWLEEARAAIAAAEEWDDAQLCEATHPAGDERCLLHRGHGGPHRSLYADWGPL